MGSCGSFQREREFVRNGISFTSHFALNVIPDMKNAEKPEKPKFDTYFSS